MIFSRKLIESLIPAFKKFSDQEFSLAVRTTGNELPMKDIYYHPKLNNLVIGKLISFEPHKDSNHMNVCQVQIDEKGTINQIVCGASNLKTGKNIIVALPGARLYDGRVIEKKVLRGIESNGMICAYSELTPLNHDFVSNDDAKGVMLFDDGKIGDTNVAEFLGLDDVIYKIEVPYSNRNDIEGVLAFCQDIAGYFKVNFKFPEPKIKATLRNKVKINVKRDKKICDGIAIAKVKNVDMSESDWKMKGLLINNCIKPMNRLLDNLNFITLLTNIPTAAYDAKNIGNIEVCKAKKDEKFIGFNDKEYILDSNDIVVKTNGRIISLAGILGARDYGVTKQTKDAYLEFANFDYVHIRKTCKKHNIFTTAGKKNTKAIPIFTTLLASSLLQNDKYFHIEGYEINANEPKALTFNFNPAKICSIIGQKYPEKEIIENLKYLGFVIKNKKIYCPMWRNDISGIPDLAEELLKKIDINGALPDEHITSNKEHVCNPYTDYSFVLKAQDVLANNYLNEVLTYNLSNVQEASKFNIFELKENIEVISSNENRRMIRNNLFNGMLKVYGYNASRKNPLIPVFEIEKIYQNDIPSGFWNLTILSPKTYYFDKVNQSKIIYNVNGLKAIIDEFCDIFNQKVEYSPCENKFFYPNECVNIKFGESSIGYIGKIRASVLNEYGIKEEIYAATINWDKLHNNFIEKNFILKNSIISNLMTLYKDITFKTHNFGLDKVFEVLDSANFIDHYEIIDKFDKDKYSTYTFRFYFKNEENISNEKINSWISEVIEIFKDKGFPIQE